MIWIKSPLAGSALTDAVDDAPSDGKSVFYFIVHSAHWEDDDMEGTPLSGEIAAIAHAYRVIRELREGGGYDDPSLIMTVKDDAGRVVVRLPFKAAAPAGPAVVRRWSPARRGDEAEQ